MKNGICSFREEEKYIQSHTNTPKNYKYKTTKPQDTKLPVNEYTLFYVC